MNRGFKSKLHTYKVKDTFQTKFVHTFADNFIEAVSRGKTTFRVHMDIISYEGDENKAIVAITNKLLRYWQLGDTYSVEFRNCIQGAKIYVDIWFYEITKEGD